MNYFEDCNNVGEIKKRFHALMFENHPDRHGPEVREQQNNITAAIIAVYHELLSAANGTQSKGTDGRTHTYSYNRANEAAVIAKIQQLLALRLSGVQIQLIGLWIWVTGDTKPVRAQLKEASMRWHSKRLCWYWKPYSGRRTRYNKRASLRDLADTYGSKQYENEQQAQRNKRKAHKAQGALA